MSLQSKNTQVALEASSIHANLRDGHHGDVMIRCSLTDAQVDRIREMLPQHTVHVAAAERVSDDEALEMLKCSQIAFGQIPPKWLDHAANLKWIQLDSVGFDPYLGLDLSSRACPLQITNLRDLFAVPVAESAIAGLLALFRGINELQLSRAQKKWCKAEVRPRLRCLDGSHVLLAGYGSIGQRLHSLFSAMGCQVTAFARTHPEAQLHSIEALDEALPTADVVCLSLPHTEQTDTLFNSERLSRLKPTTVLINVGRAGVVDESALIQALTNHQIAGAVLDVTEIEPLPADNPLWSTPNTILTQHTGGGIISERDDKVSMFVENLKRYLNGEPLHHLINIERGY